MRVVRRLEPREVTERSEACRTSVRPSSRAVTASGQPMLAGVVVLIVCSPTGAISEIVPDSSDARMGDGNRGATQGRSIVTCSGWQNPVSGSEPSHSGPECRIRQCHRFVPAGFVVCGERWRTPSWGCSLPHWMDAWWMRRWPAGAGTRCWMRDGPELRSLELQVWVVPQFGCGEPRVEPALTGRWCALLRGVALGFVGTVSWRRHLSLRQCS